jgi:hypothetical protein
MLVLLLGFLLVAGSMWNLNYQKTRHQAWLRGLESRLRYLPRRGRPSEQVYEYINVVAGSVLTVAGVLLIIYAVVKHPGL